MLGLHCFEGFSLVAASGVYSLVVVLVFLMAVVSLAEHGLQGTGLPQRQFLGSRAQAQ